MDFFRLFRATSYSFDRTLSCRWWQVSFLPLTRSRFDESFVDPGCRNAYQHAHRLLVSGLLGAKQESPEDRRKKSHRLHRVHAVFVGYPNHVHGLLCYPVVQSEHSRTAYVSTQVFPRCNERPHGDIQDHDFRGLRKGTRTGRHGLYAR